MARPKRYNADYFSHDAGMRDDPKVKALRNKFGITGYAVWCMMLEVLTNSDHFKRSIDDIEIEILSADFGIDAELFSDILSYMVRLRLLQTVDNCGYLSQKLCDRLQSVTDKRRNSNNRGVSVTESTQSKVKETKGKKSEVNKPVNKETKKPLKLPEFIDRDLWEDFMDIRKQKKAVNSERALNSLIKKLTDVESFGKGQANFEIERAIENSWKSIYPSDKSILSGKGKINFAGYSVASLNSIVEKMRAHQATTHDISIFQEASKDGFKPNE